MRDTGIAMRKQSSIYRRGWRSGLWRAGAIASAVGVLLSLLALGFAAQLQAAPPQTAAPPVAPVAPAPATGAQQASAAAAAIAPPFAIVDAAHGGSEGGARLSPALLEKDVTLLLARRLEKELQARGIPSVLTRAADMPLTADQRALAANTSHAALFVSLHAAASGHGVRFYTALLASSQPGEDSRSFLPWQAAQSPYLAQSNTAAVALSAECASGGLPVRLSAGQVPPLKSIMMPAVAVELSPLGASPEELADPEYQQKMMAALASGIARLREEWKAAR
jgi:N-acetylmuramoyl-L-alanine amidase